MATYIRSFDPIWKEFDLSGLIFDDTYYLFVLQNVFPYLPQNVYHTTSGTVWNNPIQFLANGTLPVDIFWDPTKVYRLEFRHGDNQSDPLIYLVENYIPGSSGSVTPDMIGTVSDNQITNAQFSLVNFSTPLEITGGISQTIDIAPGWFLDLVTASTGSVTITQVPLNDDAADLNPTNAPYALEINTSGSWSSVKLRQRFYTNGMLWSEKTVASSVTAKIPAAPQSISAQLVPSTGTPTSVLDAINVSSSFEEYQGYGTLPITDNTDLPPVAYMDYILTLPNTVDIYLTSFQLVVQDIETKTAYIQDSIQRQQDYTWHYYLDSVLRQPKESLLTGWDFGLNPWQFTTTASTTVGDKCAYTADQTIIYQQGGASQVAVKRGTSGEDYAFEVKAVTATNKFALIQYIDTTTVRDVWNTTLSSLVKAYIATTHSSEIQFKMRLIYRPTTAPPPLSDTEPFASWSATDGSEPVLAAGWTYIVPKNDPIYTFGARGESFVFEGMVLPIAISTLQTLGIVIYTLNSMDETATADRILFERVSLCRNDFAIDGQILTFDETLRRCQYYFESSKDPGILVTTSGSESALLRKMNAPSSGGNTYLLTTAFGIEFNTVKRFTPINILYTEGGTANQVTGFTFQGASGQISTGSLSVTSLWNERATGLKATQFTPSTSNQYISIGTAASEFTEAFISFHYTADSRMGI